MASGFSRAIGICTPGVATPVFGGNFGACSKTNTARSRPNHRAMSILACIITGVKLWIAIFLLSAPLALAAAGGRALPSAFGSAQTGAFGSAQAGQDSAGQADSAEFFEAKIRPVLAASCYDCHTEEQLGGLRLDSREAMLKGGKRGPAIVPGDPDRSVLIAAVRQSGDLKMPKGGRLKPDDIEALAAWVRAGAFWPAAAASTSRATARTTIAASTRWAAATTRIRTRICIAIGW